MKVRILLVGSLVALGLVLFPTQSVSDESPSPETYSVDAGHSIVLFRIKHLGVGNFYGTFDEVTGTFTVDEGSPENSSVNLQITTSSLDSNSKDRDDLLKSKDFFDAENNPKMTFESTAVMVVDENNWKLAGNLSAGGTSKEVEVALERTGTRDVPNFGYRTGFEATFTIDRMEFGIGTNLPPPLLGDMVDLTVAIEGVRQ